MMEKEFKIYKEAYLKGYRRGLIDGIEMTTKIEELRNIPLEEELSE